MVVGAPNEIVTALRHLNDPKVEFCCLPHFVAGDWDACVVPVSIFITEKDLRKSSPSTVILAHGLPHQLCGAWKAGVDDYLKEPWTPEEMLLRIRGPRPRSLSWNCHETTLLLSGRQVTDGTGRATLLPSTEAEILRTLLSRSGLPVSRELLEWTTGCQNRRSIDTLVSRLRVRLQSCFSLPGDWLESLRNVGYRIS